MSYTDKEILADLTITAGKFSDLIGKSRQAVYHGTKDPDSQYIKFDDLISFSRACVNAGDTAAVQRASKVMQKHYPEITGMVCSRPLPESQENFDDMEYREAWVLAPDYFAFREQNPEIDRLIWSLMKDENRTIMFFVSPETHEPMLNMIKDAELNSSHRGFCTAISCPLVAAAPFLIIQNPYSDRRGFTVGQANEFVHVESHEVNRIIRTLVNKEKLWFPAETPREERNAAYAKRYNPTGTSSAFDNPPDTSNSSPSKP